VCSRIGCGRLARDRPIDVEAVRRDFPILAREVNASRSVTWTTPRSSQRFPRGDRTHLGYYELRHANVHRGCTGSARKHRPVRSARETLRRLRHARSTRERRLRARPTRGDQTSCAELRAAPCSPATRSSSPGSSTMPTSCVADGVRADRRRRCAWIPIAATGEVDFEAFHRMLLNERTPAARPRPRFEALGTVCRSTGSSV